MNFFLNLQNLICELEILFLKRPSQELRSIAEHVASRIKVARVTRRILGDDGF